MFLLHQLAAIPGARSIPTLHRAPREFYSYRVMPPVCGTAARTVNRRRQAPFPRKPKYHKCAPPRPVWDCPVKSPKLLPEKNLRAAAPSLSCAIPRQFPVTEIPFLRAKIPFSAPPIARIPPDERPPAKLLGCRPAPPPAKSMTGRSVGRALPDASGWQQPGWHGQAKRGTSGACPCVCPAGGSKLDATEKLVWRWGLTSGSTRTKQVCVCHPRERHRTPHSSPLRAAATAPRGDRRMPSNAVSRGVHWVFQQVAGYLRLSTIGQNPTYRCDRRAEPDLA